MSGIFCYAPQRQAVEIMLRDVVFGSVEQGPCGNPNCQAMSRSYRVQPVVHPEQLMGLENVNFAIVSGHPHQVPSRIYETLRIYGATIWNLDDSWRRDRYNERQRGKHR